jgi:hypothetical protein
MGLEKNCEALYGGRSVRVSAHLEPAELRLRGSLKLAIPVAEMQTAEAKRGILHVKWPGGTVDLHLGPDAEKWALAIRYPRGRLDKLGIKPGMRVAVVGLDDAGFLAELRERTDDVMIGRAKKETEAILVALAKPADLRKLKTLRAAIRKNGMIWVVWPKGRKEFREDDVRAYGPTAGLVDVKVMSFSDTLSGLKLVIRVKDR